MLPSIKISIPIIFFVWCVLGVLVHGVVLLAYPAMWLAVAILFLVINTVLGSGAGKDAAGQA